MKRYEVTFSFVVEVEAPDSDRAYILGAIEVDDMLNNEAVYASDMHHTIREWTVVGA